MSRRRKLLLASGGAALLAFLIWNLIYNLKGQYMDIDPINVYFWLFAGVLARLPALDGGASAEAAQARPAGGEAP